ncbi:haloacid dehalogenase-like hydrolase superfamily protein [Striga asiatica]|uniref:Haloacid dehalogenase-like hydrolase superfamily protein n=1 Tax=Striga asiatica TaxID=4170 RepID=A0A5A7QS32_STRAF|nr:haloacid dehalogenase-like hydrolase superfamily protein [Striga asiatica]
MEYEDSLYRQVQRPKYECLLFDLDDTLYPLSSGLANSVLNNIQDYMVEKLGIEQSKIPLLCDLLYKNYGTTMAGLRAIGYDFNYDEYHSFVHGRLPYENLKPDPVLRSLLPSLPVRKVIFTNADKVHAVKVLNRLGLEDCFEGIICFETLNPTHESFLQPLNDGREIFDIIGHFCRLNNEGSSGLLPKTPIVCKPSEQDAANNRRVAAIYNLSRRAEWFGRELETMGRDIADLSAEIGDIRLTIRTMVRDKQKYRDVGNRGVRGGFRGGSGGRGPSGAPRRRSSQPPFGDEDGEETVSEVNPFDDFPTPHVEADPFVAYDGRDMRRWGQVFVDGDDRGRHEEAAFVGGYRARPDWGLDREYSQWEGPFRVDIPKFDSEQVDGPLYDGPPIFDEEPPGSEDEVGTVAIKTIALDAILGGVASGFKEFEAEEFDMRLYILKQFNGATSNIQKRAKALEVFVWVERVTQVEERRSVIRATEYFVASQGGNAGLFLSWGHLQQERVGFEGESCSTGRE